MATPTYIPLATITLGSAQSSVTFGSIPATYRDLVIVMTSTAQTSDEYTRAYLNGDYGTSNYSFVQMFGSNNGYSGTGSYPFFGQVIQAESCLNIMEIMDYSATDKHKSALVRSNLTTKQVAATALRWANTNAVNSIQVTHGTGSSNYTAGSTFSLYAIH
jgi:hypothetical protein